MSITLAVVTGIPDPLGDEGGGNLVTALGQVFVEEQAASRLGPFGRFGMIPMGIALLARIPVFKLGEILILGEDGREVDGDRRHPGKWALTLEVVPDLPHAVELARKVIDECPVVSLDNLTQLAKRDADHR